MVGLVPRGGGGEWGGEVWVGGWGVGEAGAESWYSQIYPWTNTMAEVSTVHVFNAGLF